MWALLWHGDVAQFGTTADRFLRAQFILIRHTDTHLCSFKAHSARHEHHTCTLTRKHRAWPSTISVHGASTWIPSIWERSARSSKRLSFSYPNALRANITCDTLSNLLASGAFFFVDLRPKTDSVAVQRGKRMSAFFMVVHECDVCCIFWHASDFAIYFGMHLILLCILYARNLLYTSACMLFYYKLLNESYTVYFGLRLKSARSCG